jgi:hypothetical protein
MRKLMATTAMLLCIGIAGSARADVNLWIDDASGNIGLVDITTGTVSKVSFTGVDLTDIGFVGDQMYGTDFNILYSINDNTGATTAIAQWSTGENGMNAMVGFGPNLLVASNATNEVYNATVLGATTNFAPSPLASAGDLAFGKDGNLYESGIDPTTGDDALVDVTTGKDIGLFSVSGSNLNAVFGLATDNNGVTYAVDGTIIYTVNLTNAVLTPILNYAPVSDGLGAAQGTAFVFENSPPTTIPEPSTWVMICLGFAGVGYVARNRARSALRCA